MKHTWLYIWYPLSQVQWDICDPHSHQTWNYLVKGDCLYSRMWN